MVYTLSLTVSHSPVYFPLACAALCAVLIWRRKKLRPAALSDLKLPLTWIGTFCLWEFLLRPAAGEAPLTTPFAEALVLAPVFLLYRLPVEAEGKRRTVELIFWVLAGVFSLLVLLGLLQQLTGINYPSPRQLFRENRLYGFYNHYNQAGSILSPLAVFLIGMGLLWQTTTLRRLLLWIAAAVLITGTLVTYSRGYFVALVVSLLLMLPRKSVRAAVWGASITVAVLALLAVASPSFRARSSSIFDVTSHPSNMERIYFMKIALDIISDHPVTGIGQKQWAGHADKYAEPYKKIWSFSNVLYSNPHNLYLLVAVETGIIGLVLFMLFWVPLAHKLIFRPSGLKGSFSHAFSLGTGFVIINQLIGGFFDTNLKRPINVMFVVLLVSLAFLVKESGEPS